MKYTIEKNTVQETLVIPLYGRKKGSELYPTLYQDPMAIHLMDQIDYDFSNFEKSSHKLMIRFGFLEAVIRHNDMVIEVNNYLKKYPRAAVVNLGCGLDDLKDKVDNGQCTFYDLDFPDVIKIRQELLPPKENERYIGCDLNDFSWMEKIDGSKGAIFFACGVFYYFLKEQVHALILKLSQTFKEGRIVFDAANKKAVRLMLKTWIKDAKIRDVNAYFSISNAKKELSPLSEDIQVSSRGYMLGYHDLKDPSISHFFRFLAKIGDRYMKMQIVGIDFKRSE